MLCEPAHSDARGLVLSHSCAALTRIGVAQSFEAFKAGAASSVRWHGDCDELPQYGFEPCLAVIATRAADALGHFEKLVAKGIRHVYLEKPGAESVEALLKIKALAVKLSVQVTDGLHLPTFPHIHTGAAH